MARRFDTSDKLIHFTGGGEHLDDAFSKLRAIICRRPAYRQQPNDPWGTIGASPSREHFRVGCHAEFFTEQRAPTVVSCNRLESLRIILLV